MSEKTLYLSAEEIESINAELGKKITADYSTLLKEKESLIVVVTLKGAALFAADVVRHMDLPLVLDFVRATSYGGATQSSGNVRILKDIESDIQDRHVLLLDEIIDTGYTIDFLLSMFKNKRPASLKVCTLLNKPSRRKVEVEVDYCGKDVEDKFLIGYGLDFDEAYRNLKDIYYLS